MLNPDTLLCQDFSVSHDLCIFAASDKQQRDMKKEEMKPWVFFHRHMLENITYDDLHEIQLKGTSYTAHKCGYLTENGTMMSCNPYHHINLLSHLVQTSYKDLWNRFYETSDREDIDWHRDIVNVYETFFMIELGWVKIEAYIKPGQGSKTMEEFEYDWKAVRIYPLSEKQQEYLFPR
jgi:hypothetical protein